MKKFSLHQITPLPKKNSDYGCPPNFSQIALSLYLQRLSNSPPDALCVRVDPMAAGSRSVRQRVGEYPNHFRFLPCFLMWEALPHIGIDATLSATIACGKTILCFFPAVELGIPIARSNEKGVSTRPI